MRDEDFKLIMRWVWMALMVAALAVGVALAVAKSPTSLAVFLAAFLFWTYAVDE